MTHRTCGSASIRVPFLYSTNGEVTWFHDVRHPLNLSRQVANFHRASGECSRLNGVQSEIDAIAVLLDVRATGVPRCSMNCGDGWPSRPSVSPKTARIAHAATYRKSLVDIISMVKHAAKEEEPLLTSAERVERAFARLTAGRAFTEPQRQWLDRIREHVVQNLSIDRDDFDSIPVLHRLGGWGAANRAFDGKLEPLLVQINESIAAYRRGSHDTRGIASTDLN